QLYGTFYFGLLHHVDSCVCRFPVILTDNDFIYFTCSLIIEVVLSNICHTIEITFVVIQHSCDNFLLKLYIHWFLHFLYPSDNISPYISSAMSPKSTVFASYCPSSLYSSNPATVGANFCSFMYLLTIDL